MDSDPKNPGDAAAVVRPAVKKKGPKGPWKPRSECTPEEIAILDAEAVKRRGRRAKAKAATAYIIEAGARRQA
ncbi:Subtilisin-like protease [Hordeum vulgare]|nr:Subtilisin-like protease [Hordeum vulgare]